LQQLYKGDRIALDDQVVMLVEDIPAGHKLALASIEKGAKLIKYGQPIGEAIIRIRAGDWVHGHNVKTLLDGNESYDFRPDKTALPASNREIKFQGYRRKNGRIGIRNEIWIVLTVGCMKHSAELLARRFKQEYPNAAIDDIVVLSHDWGCSHLGDDLSRTQRILAALIHHPNAAGVLILGLGCENNQMPCFMDVVQESDSQRLQTLCAQDVDDEMAVGLEKLKSLCEYAEQFSREDMPAADLCVGVKCGGSDGYSGITANPVVGRVVEKIIAAGGSCVMSEVPEMFGAETGLLNRSVNQDVFNRGVAMIHGFKDYFRKHNQTIYENPSPGNKAGGITTLEEKSLGCIQKGGRAPIVDILQMGERFKQNGFNLVDGPGNDLIAVTNLVASGAQVILFTTGRGTPLGSPVPTIKISSNSTLAQQKPHWIDFDAGELIGGHSLDELAECLLNQVLDVASGKMHTLLEQHGHREICVFKDGVIL